MGGLSERSLQACYAGGLRLCSSLGASVCLVVPCLICSASSVSPDKPRPDGARLQIDPVQAGCVSRETLSRQGAVGWHSGTSQSLLREAEETGGLLQGQGGQA